MTWRPSEYLLEGELDNRVAGRITGWLRFAGMPEKVVIDLQGDFDPDIRGLCIRLTGSGNIIEGVARYQMKGFGQQQTGEAGHITAGLPPHSLTGFPYLEWYSKANDRVVMYLEAEQVQILDQGLEPVPGDLEHV